MYPVLYKKDETEFDHNGLGVLSGAISAGADEELNGPFETVIEYDADGFLASEIENGMIVKVKTNDRQEPQLFRIYAHEKSLTSDNLVIYGQHITYDLADNFVEQLILDKVSLKDAMEAIKRNLAYPTKFNITSTNNETISSTKLYRTNPLQMIAGMQGSILQIWGGQIERDNFDITMHRRRGSDDGVLVMYKKNLIGLEAKFDESDVVTRIFPFKYIEESEEGPEQLITIDGKYIDSPNINKYPVIKILPVDFSEDESITNKTQLYNASKNYFNRGSKDLPKVEMDVEFESLHGTEEYKNLVALELVGMGDTITVRHTKMGVDIQAQVINIDYDAIAEKNKKVSIGNVKARLTDTINNAADQIAEANKNAENAKSSANEAINSANGKNTNFYGPDEPIGAKKDDIWFKTVDGDYTRTYRFDGVQWQLVVSVDIRDLEKEAQDAKDRADEAVAKADNATANANDAIKEAQKGFDAAQDALGKSTIADSKAQQAIDKAQGSFDAAQDALSKSNAADSKAQQAIDKAQEGFDAAQGAITKSNDAFSKAQESFDNAKALAEIVDEQTGEISTIKQTAKGLQSQVDDNKGNISVVTQLANGLQRRVTDAEGNITTLTQTATLLNSTITTIKSDLYERKNILPYMELGGLVWTDGKELKVTDRIRSSFVEVDPNATYTMSVNGVGYVVSWFEYDIDKKWIRTRQSAISVYTVGEDTAYIRVVKANSVNVNQKFQLEKGSKVTPYAPHIPNTASISQEMSVINQTIDSIATRVQSTEDNYSALTQTVGGIQTEVNKKVNTTTYNSKMTQLDSLIQTKVSQADADSKYTQQSVFNQFATGFTTRVEQIENWEIGARNLARNTDFSISENISRLAGAGSFNTISNGSPSDYDGIFAMSVRDGPGNVGIRTSADNTIKIIGGETYTLSFDFISQTNLGFDANYTYLMSAQGNQKLYMTSRKEIGNAFSTFTVYRATFTFKANNSDDKAHLIIGANATTAGTHRFRVSRIKIEKGNKSTDWTPAPEDVDQKFSAINQTIDVIATRVQTNADNYSAMSQTVGGIQTEVNKKVNTTTYNSKMTQLDTLINTKVSETTADGKYATKTQLTQTADSITASVNNKVDTTTYDSYVQQTAQSLASKISTVDANSKFATQSSLTQTAQGLQTQVSDKADKSTVTQLSGVVDTKISTTDANGKFATQSQLTQTSNSLQSTITGVRKDLDGLTIGGTNLLANSKGDTLSGWANWGDTVTRIASNYLSHDWIWMTKGTGNQVGIRTPVFNMQGGVTYVVSFLIRSRSNSGYSLDYIYLQQGSSSISSVKRLPSVSMSDSKFKGNIAGDGLRVWFTFSHTEDVKDARLLLAISDRPEGAGFVLRASQVEEGTLPTSWSPSVDDMATQSQFSQLSDAINIRVKEGEVINQINIDTSGILISGKKLILDGDVTVRGTFKVSDANIVSIDAAKMTTGELNAAKVSVINLNASNITTGTFNVNNVKITATNGKAHLDLSSTGLQSFDSNGIMRIALNIRTYGVAGSDPATLRFFGGDGKTGAGVGMNVNDTFVIGSTSNKVHNEIYSGGNTIVYANQFRVVAKEGTGGYSNRYFIFNSLESETGDFNPCLYPDRSGWGYIGTHYNRMYRIYTNYLHYTDLVNLSTRDSKSNIQTANLKQMQDAFDEMDLVTYNYKNEDGTPRNDELKVGWIAEDSPSIITSKDKKQVSLNNTIGVIAGSLKYQQQTIANHHERIEILEKTIENLLLKVAELEMAA